MTVRSYAPPPVCVDYDEHVLVSITKLDPQVLVTVSSVDSSVDMYEVPDPVLMYRSTSFPSGASS